MKKIFTLLLVFVAAITFAQRGAEISLQQEFDTQNTSVQTKSADKEGTIVLPGNWDQVTAVGTYRWVDSEDNTIHLGWIFGNNTYGAAGAGVKFNTPTPAQVVGAHFWISQASAGTEEITFAVYAIDGVVVGDVLGSVTMTLDDVTALPTGEGVVPGDYVNSFYVTFDAPIDVSGDYFVGVICNKEWTQHGDGIGIASGLIGQGGGGTGTAMIYDSTPDVGWEQALVWNAAIDLDLGVFPALIYGPGEYYEVTFNLNMTGAVAVGDVTFDPAIHDVYIKSATFANATPGDDVAFKLEPVGGGGKEGLYDWVESWEGYDDFTVAGGEAADDMALAPWKVVNFKAGTNNWGASDFSFTNEGTDYGVIILNPSTTDPAIDDEYGAHTGSKYAAFTQYNGFDDNKWLISPALEVTTDSELSFWARAMTHAYGEELFAVLVSTTDNDPGSFTKISEGDYLLSELAWTQYTFSLGAYDGETIYFAINYLSYDAFFFFVDNFIVTNVVAPTEYWYTITLSIAEGNHDYKYFLVEDAPTETMGEWASDVQRKIVVTEAMTKTDVWGDEPVSVPVVKENEFAVYPNPASDYINIVSGSQINSLRVFDLSGRLVFSQAYDATQVQVNVNNFKTGLYIMQIATSEGIQNVKFSVVK